VGKEGNSVAGHFDGQFRAVSGVEGVVVQMEIGLCERWARELREHRGQLGGVESPVNGDNIQVIGRPAFAGLNVLQKTAIQPMKSGEQSTSVQILPKIEESGKNRPPLRRNAKRAAQVHCRARIRGQFRRQCRRPRMGRQHKVVVERWDGIGHRSVVSLIIAAEVASGVFNTSMGEGSPSQGEMGKWEMGSGDMKNCQTRSGNLDSHSGMGRVSIEKLRGGEDRDDAFEEVASIAGHDAVSATGLGGGCLEGVFEIGKRELAGFAGVGVAAVFNHSPAEDFVYFEQGFGTGATTLQQVVGGGQAVPRDDHEVAEVLAAEDDGFAFGSQPWPVQQHIEQDIRIGKDAHGGLLQQAVFIRIVVHADVIGRLAGQEPDCAAGGFEPFTGLAAGRRRR
jgi:hypothetical protein